MDQARPTSRNAPGSVSRTSRSAPPAVGGSSAGSAGTMDTPSPAATKPRTTGMSSSSKTTRGAKPAWAHSSSDRVRSSHAGPSMHEVLGRGLGQRDLVPPGQGVVRRDGQAQRLGEQPGPLDVRVARPPGGELEVGPAARDEGGPQRVVRVLELEPDPRVRGPERGDQAGDEPGAQRQLEGHPHAAALRVDQLLRGGQTVVEGVQRRVDVALEHAAGVGGAQQSARPHQQRRPDLLLEPLQAAGHAGLAHLVQLGDLGDGGAVGHLLEEAQDLGVHNP